MRSDLAPTPLYELSLMLAAANTRRLSRAWNVITALRVVAREHRIAN